MPTMAKMIAMIFFIFITRLPGIGLLRHHVSERGHETLTGHQTLFYSDECPKQVEEHRPPVVVRSYTPSP